MQIYKITNRINKKIYIGQDSKNRQRYYGSGILINRAIKKYGKESFKKEILEECSTIEELNEKEIFWIKKLNSNNRKIGYNLTDGGHNTGTRGLKMSKETRKKMRNSQLGKHHTDETKKKLKNLYVGKTLKEIHGIEKAEKIKEKISLGGIGKHKHLLGKTWDEYYGIDKSKKFKEKLRSSIRKYIDNGSDKSYLYKKGTIPWNKGKKNCYTKKQLESMRKPKSEQTKRSMKYSKSVFHIPLIF